MTTHDTKSIDTKALLNAPFWVFDLDNTLYHHSCDLFAQIDVRMSGYIQTLLNIPHKDARAYQKQLFHKYGTTIQGLVREGKINDPTDFLNHIHNLDYSVIAPDPLLDKVLSVLKAPKYILTNGPRTHAISCLERLGITHHFIDQKEDRLFDTLDANLFPKPNKIPYEKFKEKYDLPHLKGAVFVDDVTHNLLVPHHMGMQTIWVNTESETISGIPEYGDHIHHSTKNTTQFLATLLDVHL